MENKRFIIVFGAVIITLLMISSATAVNTMINGKNIEKIGYKNKLKNEEIENENNDKKDLIFNLIVKILNNEEIKKDLKKNLNIKIPKFFDFKTYDYDDIEDLYQKGLKIYSSLNENQIKQKKEKFDKIIQTNYDSYESISNSIRKNKEIMEEIEELSKNYNCNECDKSDIDFWYPGKNLICATLFIILMAYTPIAVIGICLIIISGLLGLPMILGKILWAPIFIPFTLGVFFGCWEDILPTPFF